MQLVSTSLQGSELHPCVHSRANQPEHTQYHDSVRGASFSARGSPTRAHRVCVALQTGGLLSDVFLHLVPHSFMGEHQDGGVHFVMVEEKRNILIGYVAAYVRPRRRMWLMKTYDG